MEPRGVPQGSHTSGRQGMARQQGRHLLVRAKGAALCTPGAPPSLTVCGHRASCSHHGGAVRRRAVRTSLTSCTRGGVRRCLASATSPRAPGIVTTAACGAGVAPTADGALCARADVLGGPSPTSGRTPPLFCPPGASRIGAGVGDRRHTRPGVRVPSCTPPGAC